MKWQRWSNDTLPTLYVCYHYYKLTFLTTITLTFQNLSRLLFPLVGRGTVGWSPNSLLLLHLYTWHPDSNRQTNMTDRQAWQTDKHDRQKNMTDRQTNMTDRQTWQTDRQTNKHDRQAWQMNMADRDKYERWQAGTDDENCFTMASPWQPIQLNLQTWGKSRPDCHRTPSFSSAGRAQLEPVR